MTGIRYGKVRSNDARVFGQHDSALAIGMLHPLRVVDRLVFPVGIDIGHDVDGLTVRSEHVGHDDAAQPAVKKELGLVGLRLLPASARWHRVPRERRQCRD